MARLTWHGHSCFEYETSEGKILIDPFLSGNPKADLGPARRRMPVELDPGIGTILALEALECCDESGGRAGARGNVAYGHPGSWLGGGGKCNQFTGIHKVPDVTLSR